MSDKPQTKFSILNTRVKKLSAFVVSVVAFLGAVTSLLINTGRLKNQNNANPSGVTQLIVSMVQEQPHIKEEMSVSDQYEVSYKSKDTDTGVSLTFDTDYLAPDAKMVGMLSEGPFFALPKIGLDLKLVNNSDEAIFLTEAIIDVINSRPDTRPMMAFTHHEGLIGEIEFTNDGWGEPLSIDMTASINAPGSSLSNATQPLPIRKVEMPEPFGAQYRFDIMPLLEPYGISASAYDAARALIDSDDFEAEKAAWSGIHARCMRAFATPDMMSNTYFMLNGEEPSHDDIELTDDELAMYPYGCYVGVIGTLRITWQDAETIQTQIINFEADVSVSPPEGLGSTGFEPTGDYDVALQTSGTNYALRVPISQTIRPKDFDRFFLWLGAPRSSNHEFSVRLIYNDGKEMTSKPIKFEYLRPRYNAALDELQ